MLLALTHRHGFTLADLCLDSVEKVHPSAAGREITLELDVPLAAISLSKPVQKAETLEYPIFPSNVGSTTSQFHLVFSPE